MAQHAQGPCDFDCKWCDDEERRETEATEAIEAKLGPHDDHGDYIPACPGCERKYGGEE